MKNNKVAKKESAKEYILKNLDRSVADVNRDLMNIFKYSFSTCEKMQKKIRENNPSKNMNKHHGSKGIVQEREASLKKLEESYVVLYKGRARQKFMFDDSKL